MNIIRDEFWPKKSEAFLNGLFEQKIRESGLEIKEFLGNKGDILIWHGWLAHRGSQPRNPELRRKSIITHYSGPHRPDMPPVATYAGNGGRYFSWERLV